MAYNRRGSDQSSPGRLMRTQTFSSLGMESMMDSEVVPSSLVLIAPILRVANEVEHANPRVAYLCRFYAFEKAHKLDPKSSGRGVRQFKTALLQRLEREDETTLEGRTKSNARVMQDFYRHYFRKYIQALQKADKADRTRLTKAYHTAAILFDVLTAVNFTESVEVADEILEAHNEIAEKTKMYVPYNILPLDPDSSNQAIMRYPEIQVTVSALRNTRGLPWPEGYKKKAHDDILDWLQVIFGFQKDNVSNQREHLILLLANVYIRQFPNPDQQPKLEDSAVTEVMKKLFKNYKKWCKYLGRKSSLWLPIVQKEVQQRKLLYMGLYLLIWGEAANLRFMPECLCYIYHNMATEVYSILAGSVGPNGETIKPAYGGGKEAFLWKVVEPIYKTIAKEAKRSKEGKAKHSQWRNYDDLNEFFWSPDCFRLGWPMRKDPTFFCPEDDDEKPATREKPVVNDDIEADTGDTAGEGEEQATSEKPAKNDHPVRKINFVETDSYWHIFRSFDRMWSFFILCLQAMIIIAWNGSGPLSSIFDGVVFKKVLSIFITAAVLKLAQAVLDISMMWKARFGMSFNVKLRYILKALSAAAWVIVLPTTYSYSWKNPSGFEETIKNWFGNGPSSPSVFIIAVVIYLSPNILSGLLFLLPFIRRNLERSDYKIVRFIMWWSQLPLYVGRGMHEDPLSLIKYTIFWVLLIMAKLAFSYYLEIQPLVAPTKAIMRLHIRRYEWHEFFPQANSNIGIVITLWSPIILVYFMDAQIWYAIFSTIFGGIYGAFRRLGEIRTLGMLRSRFQSLPGAFNDCLIPAEDSESIKKENDDTLARILDKERTKKVSTARFAQMWNKIITCFREEDLISNREKDLLLMPQWADFDWNLIQWPPFLLASKLPIAFDMARDSKAKDRDRQRELQKRLNADIYMLFAVQECYASCKKILNFLVRGERETAVITEIFEKVDYHINEGDLVNVLDMSALPSLTDHFIQLIEFLKRNEASDKDGIVIVLLNMLEVVKRDILNEPVDSSMLESSHGGSYAVHEAIAPQNKDYFFAELNFPVTIETETWKEKINRLHLLLTEKESAMDVPSNLEARRRISFFSNSLFMDMPAAPKVRNMISFSVLTPYYNEDVLFSINDLEKPIEDEVSILYYLRKIFPDEWNNFLERMGHNNVEELKDAGPESEDELRLWVSYRGQTLTKTVRGMMYYRQALELQAFLDMAKDDELMKGYKAADSNTEEYLMNERSLLAQCQAVADMKFTYVVSCQQYGIQKRSNDARAHDILRLMTKYPSIRVAYIDEVEEPRYDESEKVIDNMSYYSVLVKAIPMSADASDRDQNLDQVIYRIKLPGPPMLGEGKPENQNHALIFTRGEGLQTIDMNQDNYMEEAFKMRNLLQEFLIKHGVRTPTILGLREHIFTGSVSSLAWFMSNQETSFVTIGQRLLANPLKVRFHYGHPDIFERLFHLTRGGISKASKTINLSEDIFAGIILRMKLILFVFIHFNRYSSRLPNFFLGFNSTLRGGNITHHEYIQVGKGRDVGLNQISLFEAKIANGNGEQTMSRDMYRLGHRFDFFRMLSCYFTTVGFYFNTLLTVLIVYVFLYGRLYLVLSGLERELTTNKAIMKNNPLQVALASQSFVQIGFLMALPMIIEIGLERGFRSAFTDFVLMQLQLASVFFTFSLGTKTHYYGRTLLHGGAQYRATGRGFVVFHAKFAENYRLYSRSHFVKGIELLILLVVYEIFGESYRSSLAYVLITISMWFMVGTWLFAPFLFNPSGFEWPKIVDDWTDWSKWISNQGGIGVSVNKSWESWWETNQEHLLSSGIRGTVMEILLAFRFFVYQFGLVYHLNITNSKSFLVYGISWLVIFAGLLVMKGVSYCKKSLSNDYQLAFRLIKGLVFLTFLSILITIIAQPHMTVKDIIVCLLALMPTGWGMLQIAQALRPFLRRSGFWSSVKTLAQYYEMIIGLLLFTPVAILAWFPFVSEFQTRMLFNQAFSRGLQMSRILGVGPKKDKSARNKE
ncbi:callose synthase 2-like [Bidens hawaiensis]|uniref:callose synthase 2-like n=1 Tax=Bidens hawaiensis TaxID=980011 RepID=UPI004049BCD8